MEGEGREGWGFKARLASNEPKDSINSIKSLNNPNPNPGINPNPLKKKH